MKRYSLTWWLVILPTSAIAGGMTVLVTRYLTEWGIPARVVAAISAAFFVDLAVAVSMEAIAPTRVDIGPGEKALNSDLPFEQATVTSGFGSMPHGQVSIRGETWKAIRAVEDIGTVTTGMSVNVVGRNGLTLVVSTRSG